MSSKRKNPHAATLGRKGGLKGGPARAARMTPEERTESARHAVLARWAKQKTKPDLEAQFDRLASQWKVERTATSSVAAMAMHPAYQRIIGLGSPVVPLILRELRRELDHWFWALRAITGEDPVPLESRGRLPEMADAWFRWARERGYAR
jgi:hypothetical protein